MRSRVFVAIAGIISILALVLSPTLSSSQEGPRKIPLQDHGFLNIRIPADWNMEVKEVSDKKIPPVLIMVPKKGAAFVLTVNVMWNPTSSKPADDAEIKRSVEEGGKAELPTSKEKDLIIRGLPGKGAKGYYIILSDKAPKPNEFEYVMKASAGVGNLVLGAIMLTHDKASKDIDFALEMLAGATQSDR